MRQRRFGVLATVAAVTMGLMTVPAAGAPAQDPTLAAISGRVTAAIGGAALSGVEVFVAVDFRNGGTKIVAGVTSDSDGRYLASGLPGNSGGDYVCFDATAAAGGASTGGYLNQCFGGDPFQFPPANSTKVPVHPGQTTRDANAKLVAGAALSGTVTGARRGGPLGDVDVIVLDASGEFLADSVTRADGTYLVDQLHQTERGDAVCFDGAPATGGTGLGYQSQCYRHIPWDAASFALPSGVALQPLRSGAFADVNAELTTAGAISGRVSTGADHRPVPNVEPELYSTTGQAQGNNVSTGADGTYRITGVPPGTWWVCFDTFFVGPQARPECWNNKPWGGFTQTPTNASPIVVRAGRTTEHVDAAIDV